MNRYSEYGTFSGDLNTGDNLSESSFLETLFGLEFSHANFADDADILLCCLLVPQISQNSTDFCPMRAGISQIMQMTQIFFASHLSPITIYWKKSGKLLISNEVACVTDGLKWGFIPQASITILALSLTILLML